MYHKPTIEGLTTRITSSGIPIVRWHYTADPDQRPGTPSGDAWLKQQLIAYPGGLKSPRWLKEMEIDYGAMFGTKLIPEWDQWKRNGCIVIPPFTPTGYRLTASYDHGWRHPACYLVHGIDYDGNKVTLWEFYGAEVPVKNLALMMRGETSRLPDGREIPGCPYAEDVGKKLADPSIWAEGSPMQDKAFKSIYKAFKHHGVHFHQAERGGDTTIADWLMGEMWEDPTTPQYRITENCPHLIREIGLQRFKDLSATVAKNRAQPEELVDKDNDAWDAMKYWLNQFPSKPSAKSKPKPPNSFQWWRKQAKNAKMGRPVQSYSREMVR